MEPGHRFSSRMAGHQTSNKRPPQRLVRSLAGFCTTRFPDSGERERSAKTSIHRDQPVGFAGLKTRLHAAETDTNPKCKRGRHSHPRLRFGLVCSGRKCVSFGRAEYRKRNPRSWSRLNGVESQPTPGDSMPERQPRRINDLDKATRLAGHERDLQSRIPHASTVRASWIRPSACGAGGR